MIRTLLGRFISGIELCVSMICNLWESGMIRTLWSVIYNQVWELCVSMISNSVEKIHAWLELCVSMICNLWESCMIRTLWEAIGVWYDTNSMGRNWNQPTSSLLMVSTTPFVVVATNFLFYYRDTTYKLG